MFKTFEKLISRLSTNIVPIAHEMIDFVENQSLAKRSTCKVMLNGSACGVDLEEFDSQKWPTARNRIRNECNIPEKAVVIGVVARLTGDKGINELVSAFAEIAEEISYVYLLIVGGQEEKDKLRPDIEHIIETCPRIQAVGWQKNSISYYMAMDIFCLPTYREGFGKVNLEAQAMGLPVVSTNVIGPRESVKDGETGFLVEARSSEALIEPLKKLVLDSDLRKDMGRRGRKRIEEMFNSKDVINATVEHRLKLLSEIK
jgi:glycosyltransferase involved in cell wall biosynthesis